MSPQADIGLVGLAVMGQNLVLNMADHGYRVAVFNRTTEKVDAFLAGPAAGTSVAGTHSLAELAASLRRPRVAMLMVQAGEAVDATISQLVPHLEPGDVIVDGGNSNFEDSIRRERELRERGLLFVGTGISGGEEGARHGPSIMPGGNPEAWPHVREIFQGIAAKVDGGTPCCDWVGEGGAGHYVKMVHNGIEYGDMQVIAEAYDLLRTAGRARLRRAARRLRRLEPRQARLATSSRSRAEIMAFRDDRWRASRRADPRRRRPERHRQVDGHLVPRARRSHEPRRRGGLRANPVRAGRGAARRSPRPGRAGITAKPGDGFVEAVRDALYASKIVSYAQGFMLFREAAGEYGWNLNYGGIALMWRGGCIIRSAFLGRIKEAFDRDPALPNLLLDPYFRERARGRRARLAADGHDRRRHGRSGARVLGRARLLRRLPARAAPRQPVQAQRDYFGAHTYERIDRRRGERFHTNWTGRGGETASGAYDA